MNARWLPVLEALADPRIGWLPAGDAAVAEAAEAGLVAAERGRAVLPGSARGAVRATLDERLRARVVEWAGDLTEGELLDRFAAHCRDDLDDVELVAAHPTSLDLRWRGGEGTVELRAGLLGAERLDGVHLMLTTIDEPAVNRFLDDEQLRGRIALCDVDRLEKINAVRSSLCVYFEWFVREAFGARILPAEAFTAGLVQRGILSLGMG
ncbi:MAG TPA: hypothetical protein VH834_15320 [Solirubrobacteraceae bacterium]|jgi:hypothetical protein